MDTVFKDTGAAETKELEIWYVKSAVQEHAYSVSYTITTDDKFLQNMMRSVDALPARTEANLESINGRSADFSKTSVLYARRKLIPRDQRDLQLNIWENDSIECNGRQLYDPLGGLNMRLRYCRTWRSATSSTEDLRADSIAGAL